MKKILLSVLVFLSLCAYSACQEDTTSETEPKVELSMTDYNRIHLWIATCVHDDETYGNFTSLRETHHDWYDEFYDGTADFPTLMEIGRFYYMQDIYGDTTGEGDWQKEELVMLEYFGIDDEDR